MIRVGVNGFGTIGRRVAEAVARQSDMRLVGVTKMSPDYRARIAVENGLKVYAVDSSAAEKFAKYGIEISGLVEDLVRMCDVVVDCTPNDVGRTYLPLYKGRKTIFQGGEEPGVAESSFVAQCNYSEAFGKNRVRVVSCNTTSICRVLHTLDTHFGVKRARVVIARRAADPEEVGRGLIDAIVLDPVEIPSHHAEDARTVLPNLDIVTMAIKVPTTHMHLHSLMISLRTPVTGAQVIRAFEETPRLMLLRKSEGFKSTANVYEFGRELGRRRGDIYESVIWRDSIQANGEEVFFFMGVHQEAIVVPENIDAVRAVLGACSAEESIRMTDRSLGIINGG
ncbi:MAG: type II glyceraldehyde-3-phosphate dehydrogenase [Nitrososphaerota archaeon]